MPDEETPLAAPPTMFEDCQTATDETATASSSVGRAADDEERDFDDLDDDERGRLAAEYAALPEAEKHDRAASLGLARGRVVWGGGFARDFVFYLENAHFALSILRAHRLHPTHNWQRVAVFAAQLGLAFFAAVFAVERTHMWSGLYFALVAAGAVAGVVYVELLALLTICPCTAAGQAYGRARIATKTARSVCRPIGKGLVPALVGPSVALFVYFGVSEARASALVYRSVGVTWLLVEALACAAAVLLSLPAFVGTWTAQRRAYDGGGEDRVLYLPGIGPKYPSWSYLQHIHFHRLKYLLPREKRERIKAELEAYKDAPFPPPPGDGAN